jgi:hypothetical protein
MNKSCTTQQLGQRNRVQKNSDLATGPEKNNTTVNTPHEQRIESLLLNNQGRICHNTLMIRTRF